MSWLRGVRTIFFGLLCCFALTHAQAQSVEISTEHVIEVRPQVVDDKLYIDADIHLALSDELREVALKGVPLHFTADIEIKQKRWWWFDKIEIKESQTWRVVYNALTRQWRVGSGDLLWPESSLEDALYPMRHIRNWPVAYAIDLVPDQNYQGQIRLRLDTSLLTRPLQVDALNGRAWSLATPWKNFSFSVDALQP